MSMKRCPFDEEPLELDRDQHFNRLYSCCKCGKIFNSYLNLYGTEWKNGSVVYTHIEDKNGWRER